MSILGQNMTQCNILRGSEIRVTLQVLAINGCFICRCLLYVVSEHLSDEMFARELSDNVRSAEPQISKTAAV